MSKALKPGPIQRSLDLEERTTRIPVRVSPDEKRKFEELADARHTNLSELIRQMLHDEADKMKKGTKAA